MTYVYSLKLQRKGAADLNSAVQSVSHSLVERLDVGFGQILDSRLLGLPQKAKLSIRQIFQTRTFWQIIPIH